MLKKLKSLKLPKLNLPQSIKLPKFSRSSESTEPEDLEFSESAQPTQSLKTIKSFTFDKTKAAKAASSMALFGLSGWFLWHTFLAVPEATLPPSLPPTVATTNPEPVTLLPPPVVEPIETTENLTVTESGELIDELIAAAETQKETDDVPDPISPDTQQASMETHDLATEQPSISNEATEPYADNPISETTTLASSPMPDEMVDELLVATGEDKQSEDTTEQLLQGTIQSSDKLHDPDALMEAEQLMTEVSESELCEEPCVDNSSPETIPVMDALIPENVPEKNHQYALTTRSNLDARECLSLTGNMDIHRCAENYR